MDRRSVPGSKGGNSPRKRRKKGGLKIHQQDGSWHVAGTLRVSGRSIRIRKSLGIPSDRPEDEAEAARAKLETAIIEEAVYGIRASRPFAAVALEWLAYATPGPQDVRIAKALGKWFGSTLVRDIDTPDIARFVADKLTGRKPSTTNRYLNTLRSILAMGVRLKLADAVPHIERPKVRKTSMNKMLSFEEMEILLDSAAPHVAGILALMMTTGCRVSEAVYIKIADVILAEGRERVIFRDTKNDETYGAPIHAFAVPYVARAIGCRQEGPVFLTDKGEGYADHEGKSGGQIKTAWRNARARLVARLIEAGKAERADVVAKATPHWLRHSFASHLMAQGESVKTIMDAGRWKTARLVIETYGHLAPDATRAAVSKLGFGGNKTSATSDSAKKKA